jgi:hypothetical protein
VSRVVGLSSSVGVQVPETTNLGRMRWANATSSTDGKQSLKSGNLVNEGKL